MDGAEQRARHLEAELAGISRELADMRSRHSAEIDELRQRISAAVLQRFD